MRKSTARKAYDQALAFAFMADEHRRHPFAPARVGEEDVVLMPAAFANNAFACELLMKAILFTTDRYAGNTEIRGRFLKEPFEELPQEIQGRVRAEIVLNDAIPKSFEEKLESSSDSFRVFRYAYEHDTLSMDIYFLSGFECVLYRIAREIIIGKAGDSNQ